MAEDYLNERRNELIQQEFEENSSFISAWQAGIGAIGLGAVIFRKRLGSFTQDALTYLGNPNSAGLSRGIDELANIGDNQTVQGLRGLRSFKYNVKKNTLDLGPVDLIDDVRSTIDIMGATDPTVAQTIAKRATEYINREITNKNIYPSFFTKGLQRLTVGDVFNNPTYFKQAIGDEQFKVLKQGHLKGLVELDTVLDRNLYKNKANQLRDLRVSKLTYVDPEGKSSSLFGKLTGGFDFFGQAAVFRSLRGAKAGVAVLGPTNEFAGPRFFVGGNVYGFDKTGTEMLLGTGRKLRQAGDPLDAVTTMRQGTSKIDPKKIALHYEGSSIPGPFKDVLQKIEKTTGVGFSFANRPSLIHRLLINPIKRLNALNKSTGVVYRHEYQMEKQLSKLTDAFIGAEYPELIKKHGIARAVEGGNKAVNIKDLSFFKRLSVVFDTADDFSVVKTASYNAKQQARASKKFAILSNKDLIARVPEGGLTSLNKTLPDDLGRKLGQLQRDTLTKAGDVIRNNKAAYYDVGSSRVVPGLTPLSDLTNYLFYRTNSLASDSLLGIGFAPGKTFAGSAARLGAIPVAYEAARQVGLYADYASEQYLGFSPIKSAAALFANANLMQQSIREATGLQQSFEFLDEAFPGSVNSEGSFAARSILAPLGGLAFGLGRGSVKLGLGIAGGIYGAIGGIRPDQTESELRAEYEGQSKVAVRKSALWGIGYSPLFGGAPKYFDYSWYYKLQNDNEIVSKYGSKEEYFKYNQSVFGIPLPTLSNLGGLRNITNLYRYEDQNYYSRPYLETRSQLESFPIIGPALDAVFGKPVRYRSPDDLPLLSANLVDRGLTPTAAKQLGIPAIAASEVQAESPSDPLDRIQRQADIAAEPLGVYKFAMEYLGVDLGPSGRPRTATSDVATSPGRALYSANLGGLFGQTEFLRRFALSEYSSPYNVSQLYNPLINNMPRFLPGSQSEYEKDRGYFIDFTRGDAYTKIERGDHRLPGAGYFNLNQTRGTPDNLDIVDKFLILADVAPYSAAYREMEKQVQNMNLEPEWRAKVDAAIDQRKQIMGVDNRYPRYENDIININESIKNSAAYVGARKAYDFLTHDILAEIPYLGSKFFPFRDPYEQYRKFYVEGAEYADWNRPYETILRASYTDMALEDPGTAAMKGAVLGGLLSGPMRFFNPLRGLHAGPGAPVFAGVSPINPRTVIGGAAIGTTASSVRIAQGKSEDYVPEYAQRESDAFMYMDAFAYTKARTYEQMALDQGDSGLASQYRQQQTRTLLGANNPMMIRAAMPTSAEKKYFDYFTQNPDAGNFEGMKGYMQYAVGTSLGRDYPNQAESDDMALEVINTAALPSYDFMGWHPSVSANAAKLKMVQHGINGVSDNIHKYGFFNSHENELKNRLPNLNEQQIFYQAPKNYKSMDELIRMNIEGLHEMNFATTPSPYGFSRIANIILDRRPEFLQYSHDYMRS